MTPIQPAHRINVGGGSNNQSLGHMEALGINTDRPKHANFAVESTRLTSFNNWPQYKHQTPQQLAASGFFYAGNQDLQGKSLFHKNNFWAVSAIYQFIGPSAIYMGLFLFKLNF